MDGTVSMIEGLRKRPWLGILCGVALLGVSYMGYRLVGEDDPGTLAQQLVREQFELDKIKLWEEMTFQKTFHAKPKKKKKPGDKKDKEEKEPNLEGLKGRSIEKILLQRVLRFPTMVELTYYVVISGQTDWHRPAEVSVSLSKVDGKWTLARMRSSGIRQALRRLLKAPSDGSGGTGTYEAIEFGDLPGEPMEYVKRYVKLKEDLERKDLERRQTFLTRVGTEGELFEIERKLRLLDKSTTTAVDVKKDKDREGKEVSKVEVKETKTVWDEKEQAEEEKDVSVRFIVSSQDGAPKITGKEEQCRSCERSGKCKKCEGGGGTFSECYSCKKKKGKCSRCNGVGASVRKCYSCRANKGKCYACKGTGGSSSKCYSCTRMPGKCSSCRGQGSQASSCRSCRYTQGKCISCRGSGKDRFNASKACGTCKGLGKCRTCKGTRTSRTTCAYCRGNGACTRCRGAGVRKSTCYRCRGAMVCPDCRGKGEIRRKCFSCKETGTCQMCKGVGRRKGKCYSCRGEGKCGRCRGSGFQPGYLGGRRSRYGGYPGRFGR